MAILITGFAGGLAQRVASLLHGEGREVVGVDYRPVAAEDAIAGIPIYQASYHKTAIEDVFRRHAFDAVLHLGRVGNLSERVEKRFDLNVVGSQKLMNLCLGYGVRELVVLSTFHIYGAHPRNHTPISEEDPVRAGLEFPQIADAIQLDSMASAWVYKHPEVRTAVLRPTNVVGPHIHNTMSGVLRAARAPYLLGFNPMVQFIHEDDLAGAIGAALGREARGVFNVAGSDVVPWRTALDLCGARTVPVPSGLATLAVKNFSPFPEYLVNFIKYPCVITDRAFREATGWAPRVGVGATLRAGRDDARKRPPQ